MEPFESPEFLPRGRKRRFTESAVRDIRTRYKSVGPYELAREYRCSHVTIWKIFTGKPPYTFEEYPDTNESIQVDPKLV